MRLQLGRLLAITVALTLAGCANSPPANNQASAAAKTHAVVASAPAIRPREHSCVSLFLLSDLSRGQTLSGVENGAEFELPVGEWFGEALSQWFWLGSRLDPEATKWALGFAPGTGIRKIRGQYEVQLLLQVQYSHVKGHVGFAGVAGSARAKTATDAAAAALEELLVALAAEVRGKGICQPLT